MTQHRRSSSTEEDDEEKQEVTVSLNAAKEAIMDIFTLK